MEWYWALTILLGLATLLMMTGLPVALVFLSVNIAGGLLFLGGPAGLGLMVRNGVQSLQN
ncbi:hypothetical protein [Pararhodobacter marinus]